MYKEKNDELDNRYRETERGSDSRKDRPNFAPFCVSPNQMESYFGFKPKAIYDLIYTGKLQRGYHYLKIGKKLVIVCDKFIEWLEACDGSKN
jgi:hypothetical protein